MVDDETSGSGRLTAAERAALKERTAEARREARAGSKAEKAAAAAAEVDEKIAALAPEERALVGRLHELVTAAAPELAPRTWYGMPAYALDGKVLCFVQPGSKFGARYTTLGFNDVARLDDGPLWATSFAVAALDADAEARVAALVRRAVADPAQPDPARTEPEP